MSVEGQIIYTEKIHILDVIGSVSRSSKCIKIVGGWGFALNPSGVAYNAPPDSLAGFKVAYF